MNVCNKQLNFISCALHFALLDSFVVESANKSFIFVVCLVNRARHTRLQPFTKNRTQYYGNATDNFFHLGVSRSRETDQLDIQRGIINYQSI